MNYFKPYLINTLERTLSYYLKKEILASHLFGYGKPHLMINAFIGDYFSIAINNKMFQFFKD